MSQSNWELETQNDLGYGELFTKFWRRRFWFSGVFCGVLAVAIPLALIKKPVYQSDMQVLVESNYRGTEFNRNSESDFTDTNVEIDYATHLKVLKSSEILKRAINKLKVEDYEEIIPETVHELRKALIVYRLTEDEDGGTETNIIQTLYSGSDPSETKRVLEAIQEVYLEYNLEQQEKRLNTALIFTNNQIPQAKNDLIQAEAALTELSKKHNLISPEREAIALKENIRAIAKQRESLKAQKSSVSGNYDILQQQLGLSAAEAATLYRLSQSRSYKNLLGKLEDIEIRLANDSKKYTDDNPIIQGLIDQRNTQRDLLIQELERVLGKAPDNLLETLESLQKQGQFVNSRNLNKITEAQVSLTGIRERDSSLAKTAAKLEQQLVDFPELIAEYRNLAQEAQIKREALRRLLEARQELNIELNRGGFNWQVIEPPQWGYKIAPSLPKDLLLSLVFATFLGGLAAFIKDAVDERITNPMEIARQTALPILGTTPGLSLSPANGFLAKLPLRSSFQPNILIKEVVQWSPFREALDLIYENFKLARINSSLVNSPLTSLAVTSSISGEGKSTFVLGLALSVARHQQRVLVIDADLRNPSLHLPFNLANYSGLSDFLAGDIDYPVIETVSLSGETIDLISSGSRPKDPVKLLSSSKLRNLIDQHKQNYDLILVDTPPVIGMADAINVASNCDSAVLMMRLDEVTVSELIEATTLISKLNVLGIVANGSKEVAQEYKKQPQYSLPPQI